MNLFFAFSTPLPVEATPMALEFGASPVDFTWMFLKMVFAMVVVIALAVLLIRYVLPKITSVRPRGTRTDMQVLDRLPLDAKKALYVVEIEGKRLLVGASDNHLSLISELEKGNGPASSKKS